jgi:hypothetical protein
MATAMALLGTCISPQSGLLGRARTGARDSTRLSRPPRAHTRTAPLGFRRRANSRLDLSPFLRDRAHWLGEVHWFASVRSVSHVGGTGVHSTSKGLPETHTLSSARRTRCCLKSRRQANDRTRSNWSLLEPDSLTADLLRWLADDQQAQYAHPDERCQQCVHVIIPAHVSEDATMRPACHPVTDWGCTSSPEQVGLDQPTRGDRHA